MKFKVGDTVRLKDRTSRSYNKQAHLSKAIVTRPRGTLLYVAWQDSAKDKQGDGGYPEQDFLPFYNGLELAIRKAKA